MKQPGINKLEDGLHELGVMGKNGVNTDQTVSRFLSVYEGMM